jgi:hypothetical protein
MLALSAAAGEIDLKYLDESGFCMWSEPSYTYYQRGEQKHLEQTTRRGRNTARLRKMGSKIKRKVFAGYLREI